MSLHLDRTLEFLDNAVAELNASHPAPATTPSRPPRPSARCTHRGFRNYLLALDRWEHELARTSGTARSVVDERVHLERHHGP